MRKVISKGGYGEHGRSCFLVEYGNCGRFYIVDCGIMDTDIFPYPNVEEKELERADYLFLTHCHKDHSGAFSYFIEKGFSGWLVASELTLSLSRISYSKTIMLNTEERYQKEQILTLPGTEGPAIQYGRSGHCPGGLWFVICDTLGDCFFSGDYQENSLFYACDKVRGRTCGLAVIDCAHEATELDADSLRSQLLQQLRKKWRQRIPVILPVPKYGRGMELLCLLKSGFPEARIRVDTGFAEYAGEVASESWWYRPEAVEQLHRSNCLIPENIINIKNELRKADSSVRENKLTFDYDFLLIADTHLKKEENASYVRAAVLQGAFLLATGRRKAGSLPVQLEKMGRGCFYRYPHHQSRGDLRRIVSVNDFACVLPYHNDRKEILVR